MKTDEKRISLWGSYCYITAVMSLRNKSEWKLEDSQFIQVTFVSSEHKNAHLNTKCKSKLPFNEIELVLCLHLNVSGGELGEIGPEGIQHL